jgi:hypothetical protein
LHGLLEPMQILNLGSFFFFSFSVTKFRNLAIFFF